MSSTLDHIRPIEALVAVGSDAWHGQQPLHGEGGGITDQSISGAAAVACA